RLEERRRKLEREAAGDLAARLRRHEGEVRRLIAELQRGPDLRTAGQTLERLRALRGELDEAAAEPLPEGPAPQALEAGARVMIPSLRREGTVVEVTTDGRVRVEVGNLRTWLKLADLQEPGAPPPPSAAEKKLRRARERAETSTIPAATGAVPHPGNSLDLRGKRLEEAVEATEAFCDALLLRGEAAAFVLHGHGTGVLKDGIRAWAKRSPYAHRWRPAAEGEGGDAWTVIELG
ncbi:MAG: Smr/MutS family protein, partial [Pseudomonadota bacterium]